MNTHFVSSNVMRNGHRTIYLMTSRQLALSPARVEDYSMRRLSAYGVIQLTLLGSGAEALPPTTRVFM